jgi:hypothetical protein
MQLSATPLKAIVGPLFMGQFPSDSLKLSLLADNQTLRAFVASDNALDPVISHLAEDHASPAASVADRQRQVRALSEPIEAMVLRHKDMPVYVRRAFEFDPHRYRELVLDAIDKDPLGDSTHRLLAALLRRDRLAPHAVQKVEAWLAENETALSASYVLKAWLDANGDPDAIKDSVATWLSTNGTDPNAAFVISSWLQSGFDPGVALPYVLPWLAEHEEGVGVARVLSSAVEAMLIHDRSATDQFIEHIEKWLQDNIDTQDGGYIFEECFKCEFTTETIENLFCQWLNRHETEDFIGYSLRARSLSRNLANIHERHMMPWLNRWSDEIFASGVLTAWCRGKKGDQAHYALAKPYFVRWLKSHHLEPVATYTLELALENYTDDRVNFGMFRQYAMMWLQLHFQIPEASQLLQPLAKLHDLDFETARRIILWSIANPDHEDAIARLQKTTPYIDKINDSNEYTTFSKNQKQKLAILYEYAMIEISNSLFQEPRNFHTNSFFYTVSIGILKIYRRTFLLSISNEPTLEVFSNCIKSARVYKLENYNILYRFGYISLLILSIKYRYLSILHDIDSINIFLEWVKGVIPEEEIEKANQKLARCGLQLPVTVN